MNLSPQPAKPGVARRIAAHAGPLVLFLLLSIAIFGKTWHLRRFYFGNGYDPISYIWFLKWWPFAILKGLNPFITRYIWFPGGFNLAWATSIPGAALIMAPVTLLAGPIVTYNLLAVTAPALGAYTAYLLARDLTRDTAASLIGGYLFGFSSYELAQLLGHLSLVMIFLVPLAVLVCLRRMRGQLGFWPFSLSLTLILWLQLGLSDEILASLCVMGALIWCVCMVMGPAEDRPPLRSLARDVAMTAPLVIVISSPFLFYLLKGSADYAIFNPPAAFSSDLLNFARPTFVTRFGPYLGGWANNFTSGDLSEADAYLGIPVLVMLAFCFRRTLSKPYMRVLLAATLLTALLSMGPHLHINGIDTRVELPWGLFMRLPLIRSALPCRFAMFTALCTGLAFACWLATDAPVIIRSARYIAAIFACLTLLPNSAALAWTTWPAPAFFTAAHIAKNLGPKPNVLILPYGPTGPGMAWQLNADFAFTQSGGYAGTTPNAEQIWFILNEMTVASPSPDFARDLEIFCQTHHVRFLLVGPGTNPALLAAIAALDWPSRTDNGIQVVPVPDLSAMKYSYIDGDYWPTASQFNWFGKRATIVAYNNPTVLTLAGHDGPPFNLKITISNSSGRNVYKIDRATLLKITLPPRGVTTLTASNTFIPDKTIHNGDHRALSALIAINPK